jgi:hypothetical protein
MGANAQTSVPVFTAGQVLTAAQMTQINTGVPVFADSTARTAAFGGTGEKTLAQGQLSYLESDGKVYLYNGTAWVSISSVSKVAAFTTSGTWTVPTGVTYAVAHIRGGGGGIGVASPGDGGNSSVAFASGTVTANGGTKASSAGVAMYAGDASTPPANSGQGARNISGGSGTFSWTVIASDGAYIVAGATVTPAASITVTVGAGGTAGTDGEAGATGYVWIEYQE